MALLKSGAGVSIPANVDTAVVALAADFDSSERTTVVLETKIAASKLAALAKGYSKAVKKLTHNKVIYYRIDDVVEAVILRGHLVLTNKGRAASLIDLAKAPNSKRLTTNKKVMALVKAVDTRKDLWMVFALPRKVRSNLGRSVPGGDSITSASASVDVQSGMVAKIRIGTNKASTATAMVAAFALGKGAMAEHAKVRSLGLSAAVKAVVATRVGNNVDIALRMTTAELEKLGRLLGSI